MKRWYVACTKPGGERLAESNLARQGFETYLPRVAKKTKTKTKALGLVTVPLFPRYIFIRVDLNAAPWRAINSTYGISRLVAFGDRPAPVANAVIEEIRGRELEDGLVSLAQAQPFTPGEAVSIAGGAFEDRTGIFQCRTDKDRVRILLSLLGRDLTVSVPAETVRRVA